MTGLPSHLALVGPTATGKSALALAAAAELGDVEIVSVDSMQVYRGMDIGTAKPTPAEREAVPHHVVDVADPGEEFSVTRFQEAATEAIGGIEARGHRALLVGGTGLYYQAVVDGLTPPGRDPGLHEILDSRADDNLSDLYAELSRLDPVAAGRIEPANRRRVVRALEVTMATGRPFSSFGPGMFAPARGVAVRSVGLWLPRDVTAARITERFATMERQGLVDEVRRLAAAPAGLSRTARQAIGYKEILEHLEGTSSLEAALGRAVDRTRALSRRQRMWFRRDPRISWLGTRKNPLAVLPALLATWDQT
ncbi:MAG: tRNA (adenosine(37)-N6)-dimethylallyltransferase MiaA [Actinomycetota bacterium]|nr:tRNA (adenosine(37)-N6)-dimethylallyltransferase MiaA [Actinomycetota bacterium]